MRSNTPFNFSKWFFLYNNIHHYKNNAFPHHWYTVGPEIKDNVHTMQFGKRLCRSSASAMRKRGINCPELRYKIYHNVWRCCYPCRLNRCTAIFSVYQHEKTCVKLFSNIPVVFIPNFTCFFGKLSNWYERIFHNIRSM